jgi:hypothetical protein
MVWGLSGREIAMDGGVFVLEVTSMEFSCRPHLTLLATLDAKRQENHSHPPGHLNPACTYLTTTQAEERLQVSMSLISNRQTRYIQDCAGKEM